MPEKAKYTPPRVQPLSTPAEMQRFIGAEPQKGITKVIGILGVAHEAVTTISQAQVEVLPVVDSDLEVKAELGRRAPLLQGASVFELREIGVKRRELLPEIKEAIALRRAQEAKEESDKRITRRTQAIMNPLTGIGNRARDLSHQDIQSISEVFSEVFGPEEIKAMLADQATFQQIVENLKKEAKIDEGTYRFVMSHLNELAPEQVSGKKSRKEKRRPGESLPLTAKGRELLAEMIGKAPISIGEGTRSITFYKEDLLAALQEGRIPLIESKWNTGEEDMETVEIAGDRMLVLLRLAEERLKENPQRVSGKELEQICYEQLTYETQLYGAIEILNSSKRGKPFVSTKANTKRGGFALFDDVSINIIERVPTSPPDSTPLKELVINGYVKFTPQEILILASVLRNSVEFFQNQQGETISLPLESLARIMKKYESTVVERDPEMMSPLEKVKRDAGLRETRAGILVQLSNLLQRYPNKDDVLNKIDDPDLQHLFKFFYEQINDVAPILEAILTGDGAHLRTRIDNSSLLVLAADRFIDIKSGKTIFPAPVVDTEAISAQQKIEGVRLTQVTRFQTIQAINAILANSQIGPERIIEILGSTEKLAKMHVSQAEQSLQNSARGLLFNRQTVLTQMEQETNQALKAYLARFELVDFSSGDSDGIKTLLDDVFKISLGHVLADRNGYLLARHINRLAEEAGQQPPIGEEVTTELYRRIEKDLKQNSRADQEKNLNYVLRRLSLGNMIMEGDPDFFHKNEEDPLLKEVIIAFFCQDSEVLSEISESTLKYSPSKGKDDRGDNKGKKTEGELFTPELVELMLSVFGDAEYYKGGEISRRLNNEKVLMKINEILGEAGNDVIRQGDLNKWVKRPERIENESHYTLANIIYTFLGKNVDSADANKMKREIKRIYKNINNQIETARNKKNPTSK